MLDQLKEEQIVNKVGGRFKLSTLIQKRLVQLNRGARPLVEVVGNKPGMQTVIEEIMHDKIFLDNSDNVIMAIDDAPDVDDRGDGGPSLDDL
ncbi:MAG: DNA-directed RNA polymerase subunit omega [Planctomycetaceae bacterium]|nr:DNA-directed RNA polymerase subunit omega [Planctomycetaceae bacterium]